MHHFLILGGDSRQLYLARLLEQAGHKVSLYYKPASFSLEEAMEDSHIILGPVPFSKDKRTIHSENPLPDLDIGSFLSRLNSGHMLFGGSIPLSVTEYCKAHDIPCFDFMKMEEVACKNAVATAEGAAAEAISLSPINLRGSACLITGWGRCAAALADTLSGMGAHITVSARDSEKLALACCHGYGTVLLDRLDSHIQDYPFIFNTVPSLILDAALIELMPKEAAVIDIATAPGGVDFEACRNRGIRAKLCPGLPGIYSPMSSARILYEAVMSYL